MFGEIEEDRSQDGRGGFATSNNENVRILAKRPFRRRARDILFYVCFAQP